MDRQNAVENLPDVARDDRPHEGMRRPAHGRGYGTILISLPPRTRAKQRFVADSVENGSKRFTGRSQIRLGTRTGCAQTLHRHSWETLAGSRLLYHIDEPQATTNPLSSRWRGNGIFLLDGTLHLPHERHRLLPSWLERGALTSRS